MKTEERERAERIAKWIANSLWGYMSTEQVKEMVEWPYDDEIAEAQANDDGDPRPAETLWLALVSWVYTRFVGEPGKHVDLLHKPPADQMNTRGGW